MKDIRFDLYRFSGRYDNRSLIKTFITQRSFRFVVYHRALQRTTGVVHVLIKFLSHLLHRKMSIEIPNTVQIGKGFLMVHPYGITLNSKVIVGDNFTILKGATIGNIKTGKRKGSPIIGNNVYVGLNSTVVGGIRIGNDVLIAANTYVNFDVPDGALVIGSPGVIHLKSKASLSYINNSIMVINITEKA